jgi:predicted dehydrogenase
LGYGFTPAPKTLVANRRKTQVLLDKDGKVLNSKFPKTSDDTIFLHGYLSTGIPISYTLRGGIPFKDTPGLDWRIYGTTGEIRVTASGPFLQVGYPDVKIEVHDVEKGTVEEVKIEEEDVDALLKEYGIPSKNTGRIYRELSEGRNVCSFEDAVERHEFIEEIYKENGIVDF